MEKFNNNQIGIHPGNSREKPIKNILFVDDEESVRILFKEALEKFGYSVRVASGGNEGMALLRENIADLVITDIFMPDKGGHDFISEITEAFASVKIFAITGKKSFDPHLELDLAKSLGATKVFTKPCKLSELLDAIKEVSSEEEKSENTIRNKITEFCHQALKKMHTSAGFIGAAAAVLVFMIVLLYAGMKNNIDGRMIENISSRITRLENRIEQIEGVYKGSETRLDSVHQLENKINSLDSALSARIESLTTDLVKIKKGSAGITPKKTYLPEAEVISGKKSGLHTHIVQTGETLSRISQRYNLKVSDLMKLNNLSSAETIYTGQILLVTVRSANGKRE